MTLDEAVAIVKPHNDLILLRSENGRLRIALSNLLNEFSHSNDYRTDSTVVRAAWNALREHH